MSRIGKKPVLVPAGVDAVVDGQQVKVKGPRGELSVVLDTALQVQLVGNHIEIKPYVSSQRASALWGLGRTLVSNIVCGVTKGFTKVLEINGVGYRAQVQGSVLQLSMGYSHEVTYPIPDGIKVECTKPTEIVVSGIDVQRVGQVSAEIRSVRSPEPYKGKGIKYKDERIFRKEGKKK